MPERGIYYIVRDNDIIDKAIKENEDYEKVNIIYENLEKFLNKIYAICTNAISQEVKIMAEDELKAISMMSKGNKPLWVKTEVLSTEQQRQLIDIYFKLRRTRLNEEQLVEVDGKKSIYSNIENLKSQYGAEEDKITVELLSKEEKTILARLGVRATSGDITALQELEFVLIGALFIKEQKILNELNLGD